MTKKAILSAIVLTLLFASSSAATETDNISGDISLGLRSIDLDHNSAKFYEYNGLKGGVFGNIFLDYDSEGFYSSLTGKNIGLDDQYYKLSGGKWGVFKYSFYYNEIPHNYSFDARTFYTGIGTNNLNYAYTTVPTDASLWSTFDYKIKRKDLGASIEFTAKSPFYVIMAANQVQRDGLYPIGAPSGVFRTVSPGSSPFGNVTELPAPTDTTTRNSSIEIGYRTKPLLLSLSALISKFDTQNEWLTFRNPYVTNQSLSETISLPPDNKYWKLKFTGALKLPLDSTLAVNAGYSKLTSEVQLLDTIWSSSTTSPTGTPTYSLTNLGLSDKTFNGDVTYKSISTVLTSSPANALSSKIYYKFLKKDNNSDVITYTNTATGTTATNELFKYEKNNAGIELGHKLARNLKATAGYDYLKITRERPDIPETKDNTYFIQVKYTPLDFLAARIKYQRLDRSAAFTSPDVPSTDLSYIENFVRRFDAAGKTQDAFKVMLDISPEPLDLSLGYAYKKDNYSETILGMTNSRRNEYILDASYEIKDVRLYGYFDYEDVRTDQTSRYINPSGTYSNDPNTAPVSNSYNWNVSLKDNNYAYGIGTEVPVMAKKIAVAVQYDYEMSNGNADFTSQILTGTLTQDSIDIPLYDDYKKQSFSVKIKYNVRKDLKFILGYIYEKLEYNDAQYQGYQYVVTSGGNPNTYLSGAYTDNSYKANVVYLKTVYTF